jgi:hypothetical protein
MERWCIFPYGILRLTKVDGKMMENGFGLQGLSKDEEKLYWYIIESIKVNGKMMKRYYAIF